MNFALLLHSLVSSQNSKYLTHNKTLLNQEKSKKKQNRILLIDDDEPTNFMSKIIIQKADENSIPSVMQNPKSALNILKNESINIEEIPDLIFLIF